MKCWEGKVSNKTLYTCMYVRGTSNPAIERRKEKEEEEILWFLGSCNVFFYRTVGKKTIQRMRKSLMLYFLLWVSFFVAHAHFEIILWLCSQSELYKNWNFRISDYDFEKISKEKHTVCDPLNKVSNFFNMISLINPKDLVMYHYYDSSLPFIDSDNAKCLNLSIISDKQ